MKLESKRTGDIVQIELTPVDGDSSHSAAVVTIVTQDGRKARGWIGARIKPNGRAEFVLTTLGKTKEGDRTKTAVAAWHKDLH